MELGRRGWHAGEERAARREHFRALESGPLGRPAERSQGETPRGWARALEEAGSPQGQGGAASIKNRPCHRDKPQKGRASGVGKIGPREKVVLKTP